MIPVEGQNGLYRDPKTDALIFINNDEIKKRQAIKAARRKQKLEQKQEIQALKNELGELKDLVKQLLEKR